MALATLALRRELARVFPDRPFAVRLWDGTTVPSTTSPQAPEFAARRPAALAHFLRAPGELGLGRAYVAGDLVVDDLDGAFLVFETWEPPPISVADRLRLSAAAALAAARGGLPRRPQLELLLRGERHSLERDAAAIRYHYDVGNEFFALFLDDSMTYSCGIFSQGAQTLEEAQRCKLDLVAKKLALRPGQRVLDVGCGWASFAIHAAREYGVQVVGITLSERQVGLARRRVAEAGLEDRIEIRLQDYRKVADRPFDAIASIGMVEHVGERRIDEYARILHGLLTPEGLLLNHGIALTDPNYDISQDVVSDRYVFPDGEPLPLSRIQLALERAGFVTLHVEGFADDYAETLRHWTARLDEHLDAARAIGGEEQTRIWRLYLRAARHGFVTGLTNVYQVRARPAN
ncbi:MAG TPA: cyclopropane-fatty-acyl-phospholipid synthase family protein [Solirubrobacteraceae bacterium]